jgi:rubrerythrin
MSLYLLIDWLIKCERRVLHIYRALSERQEMPPAVRSFWQEMTEDERTHLAVLEHSAGLLNFVESPPLPPATIFADLRAALEEAEAVVQRPGLSLDEAFAAALRLEESELNSLRQAWLQGFRPPLETLLHVQLPEEEAHLQRLIDAVHTLSADHALHQQATALRDTYQRQKAGGA